MAVDLDPALLEEPDQSASAGGRLRGVRLGLLAEPVVASAS